MRWYKKLSRYNFRIEHCKETDNVVADALNRRLDLIKDKGKEEATLFKKDSNGNLKLEKMAIKVSCMVTVENPLITRI